MNFLKKSFCVILSVIFLVNCSTAFAIPTKPDREFINKYYFDLPLGMETANMYTFGDFPFHNDKGVMSPLGEAVLSVLTSDVHQWVIEPRIYVKDDFAYIHAVKLDGLNIFYTLKRDKNKWKVVNKEEKKLPSIGSEAILEKAFLRAIGQHILDATASHYGESRLFFNERITDIAWNENEDQYDVTVQIVTYKGPINPPYGFDTITFRIPNFKVIKYDHVDVSDIDGIMLDKN
ncbi:DUF3888 domain-containing protein [Sporosarcina sp. YIM B06819]|uniref:DUF3888 domain-containing protein n=1 Tax=Sporosarcina sp. YIM B06819 TaxID=3081769 RepID=UPI00298C8754|nr:DUF3888 domain-containing protein [Sporosarcina sp. YIM B06819]